MKEFLLLIRENLDAYGKMTPEEMQQDIEKHMEWVEKLTANGNFKAGNPLDSTGKYIRDSVVTDGPYIEAKEVVSGFYFLLARSLEEAIEIAQGCPTLSAGGMVEVREIIEAE